MIGCICGGVGELLLLLWGVCGAGLASLFGVSLWKKRGRTKPVAGEWTQAELNAGDGWSPIAVVYDDTSIVKDPVFHYHTEDDAKKDDQCHKHKK